MNGDLLSEVLAEHEIRRALLRYCRGIDRADEDLIKSAYHEDSRDERGWFNGSGWEFARVIADDLRGRGRDSTHLLSNVLCAIEGSEANVESYTLALSSSPDEVGPIQLFAGRYLDLFEQRDGHWRIAHRRVVRDWNAALEREANAPFLRDLGDQLRGTTHPEDPSYGLKPAIGGIESVTQRGSDAG